jgi:hypothetical protein
MVIASMNAMTVDWLSSSKFGSARLTSPTVLITAENDHGVDYRSLTDSPADRRKVRPGAAEPSAKRRSRSRRREETPAGGTRRPVRVVQAARELPAAVNLQLPARLVLERRHNIDKVGVEQRERERASLKPWSELLHPSSIAIPAP